MPKSGTGRTQDFRGGGGGRERNRLAGLKTDITHVRVLGISVNIPTKPSSPPMYILFVCSKSSFYTFALI